jgi:hypothetical protein
MITLIGTDLFDVRQNRNSIRAQGHLIWTLEGTIGPLLQEFQFANETKRVKTNESQPLVLVDVTPHCVCWVHRAVHFGFTSLSSPLN